MIYTLKQLVTHYDELIDICYSEIEKKLLFSVEAFVLRKQFDINTGIISRSYLIEIISEKKINEENYGLVIDIQIKEKANLTIVEIDILEANGLVHNEKKFVIAENEVLNKTMIGDSIVYIKDLPIQAIKCFYRYFFND